MPAARPTTQAPQIEAVRFGHLDEGDPEELTRNADLESLRYTDLTVPALSLPGAVVSSTRFDGLDAHQSDLRGARFSEVALDQVHLPVVNASRTQWHDVRLSGRIGGLESYEARWRGVHFDTCKLDYLNLRGAELVDVAFTDCVIGEMDILDALVRRVRFTNTRVGSLNVQNAKLHDFDLRGADLASIDGVMDLRGATVNHPQLMLLAPLFADQIGLRVED